MGDILGGARLLNGLAVPAEVQIAFIEVSQGRCENASASREPRHTKYAALTLCDPSLLEIPVALDTALADNFPVAID